MKAYPEDPRRKMVEAVGRGMPKSEAAKTFGVGVSSVKRHVLAAREGRPPAPKKRPGSKPKLDEGARRLLEADLEDRPAATLPERGEFLRRARGVSVSDSTVSRVLKRLGWGRKKIGGREREGRVLEGRLARDGRREHRARAIGLRRRDGHQHLASAPACLVAQGGAGTRFEIPRNWGANVALLASMTAEGMGPCLAVEGATTKAMFEAYLERVLAPSLESGQVVVMDDLTAHKGSRVRELVEERGCELATCHPTHRT